MLISNTDIQGHSCLILDPPVLSEGSPVVVTLHGLGTNGDDLAPLGEELDLADCRFVLPDAPLSLPGYPPGAYAWYDFEAHDRVEIEKSRDYLFKVLDRFSKNPNLRPTQGQVKEPKPVILLGFSQGGVMALEAGLNYQGRVLAIVSMSGYIPDPSATLSRPKAPLETPILLIHGRQDPLVPVEGSRKAAEALIQAGYKPVLREFPMAHTITEESLGFVKTFLKKMTP
jgi:phospholipase/carboxylesterase